jgi:hypothetical protein
MKLLLIPVVSRGGIPVATGQAQSCPVPWPPKGNHTGLGNQTTLCAFVPSDPQDELLKGKL